MGTADTTHFFSPDTSSPGIHSKKCVVIEFDKKQYQFKFYVGLEINAPKQYACFFEALFWNQR